MEEPQIMPTESRSMSWIWVGIIGPILLMICGHIALDLAISRGEGKCVPVDTSHAVCMRRVTEP